MQDLNRWGIPENLWGFLCAAAKDHGTPVRNWIGKDVVVLFLPPGFARPVPQLLGDLERDVEGVILLMGVELRWNRQPWRGGFLAIGTTPPEFPLNLTLSYGMIRRRRLRALQT